MPKVKGGVDTLQLKGVQGSNLSSSKSKDTHFSSSFKYTLLILFFVVILGLFVYFIVKDMLIIESEMFSTCGDGTFYDTCSLDKPYYCQEGRLIEKASLCGCPELFGKSGDFCISDYHNNPKSMVLKYILDGQEGEIEFTVFENANDYISGLSREIYYRGEEIPFRVDFKRKGVNQEFQKLMLLPLVKKIQNIAPNDKVMQARIVISIAQNIPYGFSEQIEFFSNQNLTHSRYPYEVLYEYEGICGEKSLLMAFLLKEIGYGVSIFYFPQENHEAVGIKCPIEKSYFGSGFCFIETSGPAIVSDDLIVFEGNVKLSSVPEILLVSEGISLPRYLREYRDANSIKDIREGNLKGILQFWRYDGIKERYGLDENYRLG